MSSQKLSRRVILKGLGATVALPWLESIRAAAGDAPARNSPPKRFAFLFFGDGIHPPEWWSRGNGPTLELGPAFASLDRVKEKVNFIHGLRHPGDVVGGHAKGAAGILSGTSPRGGREIRAAASLDQVLARRIGDSTALPSLVLACERPISGFHESGYSMMYASHVSWSSPVSPVPTELYPAHAFDSLFESRGNRTHASVLDHVREQLRDVTRDASRSDRARIEEYASSIREVEGRLARLQANEGAGANAAIRSQRPANGLPAELQVHARLMCDIIALAFQTDRTRIATLLLTNNLSGQAYPFLGLRGVHHGFSHGQGAAYASITRFWVEQYAYLLGRLAATQEGDGTVLDNSCIVMANEQWTAHTTERVPLLMAGGLGGAFRTGRTLDFEMSNNRKCSSLLMTLSDRMGMRLDRFGDSTEQLDI